MTARMLAIPAILLLVASLAAVGSSELATPQDPKVLRIGFLESIMRETAPGQRSLVSGEFKDLVKKLAGMDSVVLEGLTVATAARQLEDGKWHLGVCHGIELAWMQAKHPNLKALMIAPDIGSPVKAVAVAAKKGAINSLADLKGQQVSILNRLHCRLFKDKLTGNERNYFAGITETRSVEDAVNAVLNGKAAGAVVDTPTLAFFQDLEPGRYNQLKVLAESESFPPAVVIYRQGVLSDALLKHLRQSMFKANESDRGKEVLMAFHVSKFQDVPADLQKSLTAIAQAYPNPE